MFCPAIAANSGSVSKDQVKTPGPLINSMPIGEGKVERDYSLCVYTYTHENVCVCVLFIGRRR